ncbi:MAG: MFS transporter, partial [Chloroflexota bacterium]|nr:MFS transporter [Chloroflexota bacterium]
LAVLVVERIRMRKIVAVIAYFVTYATWIPVALIPFIIDVPNTGAVTLLLFFIAVRGAATAFVTTSWNGWLKDIVPLNIMGDFFAKRLRVATIAAAVTAMLAALYIDWWKGFAGESDEIFGYSYAILFGCIILGFGAVQFMARMPEPQMPRPSGPPRSTLHTIGAPFRDKEFRGLINYMFMWNFVAYLAVPFFAVYMLVRLEMPLSLVVALGVMSQVANVLFLRVWGAFVDQYGSKVVLSLSSSLYLLVILGWTFTTLPDKYTLTIPLLVVLHILIGIASAGINIASTTIRMKMAPPSQATAYLTAVSLAANLGAGISPLLGGAFVDYFNVRHFEIAVEWVSPTSSFAFPALFLTGYDFLFAMAFVLGLVVLSMLGRVREQGEVDRDVVMDDLIDQTRANLRALNSVPGLSFASHFPVSTIRYAAGIPGLDVAVGVTAYQIASSTRAAVEAAAQSGETARQVRATVNRAVTDIADQVDDLGHEGVDVALGATLGAMQAVQEAGIEAERVAEAAVQGTLEALNKTRAAPLDALRGVTYGVMRGASEINLQVGVAATQAIEAARNAASEVGLSKEEAALYAAQVAVEAAKDLGSREEAEVKQAVLGHLIETPESGTDDSDTGS